MSGATKTPRQATLFFGNHFKQYVKINGKQVCKLVASSIVSMFVLIICAVCCFVGTRVSEQLALLSPQFVDDEEASCQHCNETFKKSMGRDEHERWCKQGPQDGYGARGGDEDDDDLDDTLMCETCGEEVGGVNKGARATHGRACAARKVAALERGEEFVPSLAARRERLRRSTYSFAVKARANDAVRYAIARDQRANVTAGEKEIRARQAVEAEFKVCTVFTLFLFVRHLF